MRLKEIRTGAGLSRPQLSRMSGVSVKMIIKYEEGVCEAKLDNAQKLCGALGCSLEVLMGRDMRKIEVIKELKIKTVVLE